MIDWFNNLSFQTKIITVIIIVVILWVLWRKYGYLFGQLTQARDITFIEGENKTLTPQQESNIKDIAQKISKDIEDTPWTGHEYDGYEKALALTDKELDFLATYYKKYLGNGTSLWEDIDTQIYATSSKPAELQTRLNAIGRK